MEHIEVLSEQKVAPPWVNRKLARAGGYNRFGEPNFRVVWGWSRLTWVGGKWEEWDNGRFIRSVLEYRQVPKYDPFFRWHVEKWMAPEFFGSPEAWYGSNQEVVDGQVFYELGPYPSRGEYEHVWTLQEPGTGKFIPLDNGAVQRIVQAVIYSREMVHKDKRLSLQVLKDRQQKAEEDWGKYCDALMDDAAPAFGARPHVAAAMPWLRKPLDGVEVPTEKQTLSLAEERT